MKTLKTYYYNILDHSWDQMKRIDGNMTAIDNHIRIPEDWTTIQMTIDVFKCYINVILMPKVQDQKRINLWQSYYKDNHNEWNANGFVRCEVEGDSVIIESLNKYEQCKIRIHI